MVKREVDEASETTSVTKQGATIKNEVVDSHGAEADLARIIEMSNDGIEIEHLTPLTPALTPLQRQNAINSLLSTKRVVMVKEGGTLKLKMNNSTQLAGVSDEEQAVFSLIEEAKTKGIWIKELRDSTGLAVSQMRKALKSLENKKLIKTVKAVNTTKKCYMLFDLEPDTSLTGGTFYSDHQLDAELISTLVSVCTGFLQKKRKDVMEAHPNDITLQKELSFVKAQEVSDFIVDARVLTVSISLEDIERILEIGVLDGTIERRSDGKLRATPPQQTVSPLACIPCGICPVVDDCKPGHVISPETCRYMTEWLGK